MMMPNLNANSSSFLPFSETTTDDAPDSPVNINADDAHPISPHQPHDANYQRPLHAPHTQTATTELLLPPLLLLCRRRLP